MPDQAPDPVISLKKESGMYTAVLFVHGMGTPRRYDSLCNLVDTLEKHAFLKPTERGKWRSVNPKRWHRQLSNQDHLYYIQANHISQEDETSTQIRFFESYWAPKLAGGLPVWKL